jgi:hypothetical protein
MIKQIFSLAMILYNINFILMLLEHSFRLDGVTKEFSFLD